MWTHPVMVLLEVTTALTVGFWLGARSKVSDWHDGYRAGREDEAQHKEKA